MYFDRRFGPPIHTYPSGLFPMVPLENDVDGQSYGWPEIRANSSSQVMRSPTTTRYNEHTNNENETTSSNKEH